MLIEYCHDSPADTHQGPSGQFYTFVPDDFGRRVAEVENAADIDRFLSIKNQWGVPQFREIPPTRPVRLIRKTPKPEPAHDLID